MRIPALHRHWIILGLCLATQGAQAQTPPAAPEAKAKGMQDFEKKIYEQDGHKLPYCFHRPTVEPGRKYPVVLLLHGYGERGTDNAIHLGHFSGIDFWEKNPCFVIVPQCPKEGVHRESSWADVDFGALQHTMKNPATRPLQMVMELLKETMADPAVDLKRIYVSGLSMGGYATWELLQREPEVFAAAVPVCGGADLAFAEQLAKVPVWVWHGGADPTVKPSRSQDIVKAIEAAGGHPKYTEVPGVGHGVWGKTYHDPEMWDWLFAQHKD